MRDHWINLIVFLIITVGGGIGLGIFMTWVAGFKQPWQK